jgi:Flp pilus assembly protein TadG
MRIARISEYVRQCQSWLVSRRTSGQVALYMAFVLMGLMGLAGAGVDYGQAIIESARLQNAIDAASLAGARALVTSSGSTQAARDTAGNTAATSFLALHNYTNGVNGASFTLTRSASDGGTNNDTMRIDATVVKPTSFWKVIGIQSTTLTQTAAAVASGGMVDVMLSLDLSMSMQLSGTNDLQQLRTAVVGFIDQMQIDASEARGTQMGIARFAGIRCSWHRGRSGGTTQQNQGADFDRYVDLDKGPNGSEYVNPCTDDKTVLMPLSSNRQRLKKIANNNALGSDGETLCPNNVSPYGCPLSSIGYTSPPVVYGTPTTALGFHDNGNQIPSGQNATLLPATGTKLPNAITAVSNGSYYAWSTANGGRNDPSNEGLARKVLVIMTDGNNEQNSLVGVPSGQGTEGSWDTDVVSQANTLKLGPDGVAGTTDDVEIYVVGFYCNTSSASALATTLSWCSSNLAVSASPHKCPGPSWPTTGPSPSATDTLLRNISSSSPGTCNRYFPLQKSESLPQLFRVIAGSIAKGRLQ